FRAVEGDELLLDGRNALPLFSHPPHALLNDLPVLRMNKLQDRPPDDLLGSIGVKEVEARSIDEDDPPAAMDDDGIRRDLHEGSVEIAALDRRSRACLWSDWISHALPLLCCGPGWVWT